MSSADGGFPLLMEFLTVGFTFLCAYVIGYGALWWLARLATGDRQLRRVVLLSYSLRTLLALVLFAISSWHWPIFRSLQLPGGFWTFASDALAYHHDAPLILHTWEEGTAWPASLAGLQQYYLVVVAAVYKLLGYHALYPILVNCWFSACNGLLAYLIGKRLVDERTAFAGATLVSFWPSSFLWSSQILKESLTWWSVFAALAIMVLAISDPPAPRRGLWPGVRRQAALYGLLAAVTMVLTGMRDYLGVLFAGAALAVLASAGVWALLRKRPLRTLRLTGLIGVIVWSVVFTRSFDAYRLFSPRQLDRGHYALGLQHWQRGEHEQAEAAFREAIALHQRHKEAHLALGALKVLAGAYEEALPMYKDYVGDIPPEDVRTQTRIQRMIGFLYTAIGNRELAQGHVEEALTAYDQALRSYDSWASTHANRGIALAWKEDVDRAVRSLDQAAALTAPPDVQQRIDITAVRDQIMAQAAEADHSSMTAVPAARAPLALLGASYHTHILEVDALSHIPPLTVSKLVVVAAPDPRGASPAAASAAADSAALPPPGAPAAVDRQAAVPPLGMMVKRLRAAVEMLMAIPQVIENMRKGFLGSGGASLVSSPVDVQVRFFSFREMLAYLPRALTIGLLAPFPSSWFHATGSIGGMQVVAGLEMLLVYLLLPSLLWGLWRMGTRGRAEHLFFLVFVFGMAGLLSLTVANVGTLFRIRLSFLLPLLIVVGAGDPLGLCRKLRGWVGAT